MKSLTIREIKAICGGEHVGCYCDSIKATNHALGDADAESCERLCCYTNNSTKWKHANIIENITTKGHCQTMSSCNKFCRLALAGSIVYMFLLGVGKISK